MSRLWKKKLKMPARDKHQILVQYTQIMAEIGNRKYKMREMGKEIDSLYKSADELAKEAAFAPETPKETPEETTA